jgi:hypothetical protein
MQLAEKLIDDVLALGASETRKSQLGSYKERLPNRKVRVKAIVLPNKSCSFPISIRAAFSAYFAAQNLISCTRENPR